MPHQMPAKEPTTAREALIRELDELHSQLRVIQEEISKRTSALRALDNEQSAASDLEDDPTYRYANMDVVEAILKYLTISDGWRTRDQVIQALWDGGCARGTKRGKVNINTSIDVNVERGVLLQKGEWIGKPGWKYSPPTTS